MNARDAALAIRLLRASAFAIATVLTATPCAAQPRQDERQPRGSASTAESEAITRYEELAARVDAAYTMDADDGWEPFVVSGVANEAVTKWLEAVRPIGPGLIAAVRLPYESKIDPEQGWSRQPPSLSPQRLLARAARLLAHDAALRGDHVTKLDLLRAQLQLAGQLKEQPETTSALVHAGIVAIHAKTVDELIDRGAIDSTEANALLETRRDVAVVLRAHLLAGLRNDAEILVAETRRLHANGAERAKRQLEARGLGEMAKLLGGDKIQKLADSIAYRDAIVAATAVEDDAMLLAAVRSIEERAVAGTLGPWVAELGRANASSVMAQQSVQRQLAMQEDALFGLEDGVYEPVHLINAAPHYLTASKSAESLSPDMQRRIIALRSAPDGGTEEEQRAVRGAIEALRPQLIDRILRATKHERCVFDAIRHLSGPHPSLVQEGCEGALGALRIMLFDPLLPGARPADAPTAVDACVASLVAIRHFAEGGGIGNPLVAQRFSRDVAAVLEELATRGSLDRKARRRLGAELSRLDPDDPFGLRGGIDFERAHIATMGQPMFAEPREHSAFGRKRLADLTPDHVGFLVGTLTGLRPAIASEPCECSFDGPLLDLRGLFDLDDLESAQAQSSQLRTRIYSSLDGEQVDEPSALDGLAVTKPIDMEARLAEATADFERLQALVQVEPQAGSAAPQPPSKALIAQNARMPKPGSEGPAVEVYMEALAGEDGSYRSKRGHDGVDELLVLVDRLDKDEEALARAKTLIAQIMPDIAKLRTIRERPVFGVPFVAGPLKDARLARFLDVAEAETRTGLLTNTLLRARRPGHSMLMRASELMLASAAVALREQRTGDFAVDIETVRMVARHFGEGEDWLAAIGRDFVETEICRAICGAVSSQAEHFTEEQLVGLAAAIPVRGDALLRAIEFERRKIDEIAELCFADDGSGDGVPRDPAFETVFGPARGGPITFAGQDTEWEVKPIGRRAYLAAAHGLLDRILAAARAPSADEALALSRELNERYGDTLSKDRTEIEVPDLVGLDAAAQASGLVRVLQRENRAQAARAVIAIVRFERAKGRYPSDLAELGGFMDETLGSWAAEGAWWRFAAGSASARLEVPWYGADDYLQFSFRSASRR
ncbi:MAG: hypothetical protein GC172_08565 [Phycisphaera sp.]|nr:hypothetical protein [Phycisphaera sp.]